MIPQIVSNLVFWRLLHNSEPSVRLTDFQYNAIEKFQEKIRLGKYIFESAVCICGNKTGSLVARYDRYALDLNTYLCPNCGTLWTNPRLDSESLNQFYECDYRPIYVGEENASELFWEQQVSHGEKILQFVKNSVQSTGKLKVFDIGCGSGGSLVPFEQEGWHVYGCDLGVKYLERGRNTGLKLEYGNEGSLSQYGPANLLIYSHVIEHLADPLSGLIKAHSLLKEGGYIYIELPGIFNIGQSYRDTRKFLQNAHLYHFTLATLSLLLAEAGFELVKGDETIRAIFRKGIHRPNIQPKYQYLRVWLYLSRLEAHRYLLPILNKARRGRRSVLRKLC